MKKMLLLLFASCIVISSTGQVMRHAKGVKGIFIQGISSDSAIGIQPGIRYFVTRNLAVKLQFYFENYANGKSEGSQIMLKPAMDFSFVNIGNVLYGTLSGGFNVGSQSCQSQQKIGKSTYYSTVNEQTGTKIGLNLGLHADLFLFKGFFIQTGMEYNSLSERVYGHNSIQFLGGIGYNFP